MMKCLVYASGAEKKAPDGFTSWRDNLKNVSSWKHGIGIVDPISHFNYTDKQPVLPKQCVNYFMWLIDKCDVVLVNLDYSNVSVGTGCEVQHAVNMHKPVIGFGAEPDTWYTWTVERCEIIFSNMEDAVDYIVEHYVNLYETS